MHLLIVTQYFPPEIGALATRWGDFSKILADLDHKVTILCESPHYPNEKYYPGFKNSFISINNINSNLTVIHSKAFASDRKTSLKKLCHYIIFMLSAIFNLRKIKNFDIMIISSPPLFTGVIGLYAKIFLKHNYWLDIRDLWPDSALELNQIGKRLYKYGKFLENKIYKNAKGFIFSVPGFQKYMSNFSSEITKKPMIDLMNGVSKDFLSQATGNKNNEKKTFTVLYSGNMGLAQDLNTIVDAANLLKDYDIQFVFIGNGVCKAEVKKKAEILSEKIKFYNPMRRSELIKYIKQSAVCLVPLKKKKLFRTALPSKMFEYMACGKPVIVGINGEAETIVNTSKSGVCVHPEDPEMLSKAILKYFNDKEKRKIDGENGLNYVTNNLQKEYLISNLMKEINKS